MDIDALLAESAESPPCGPNLEHDAAFLEFELASRGKAEQQFGTTVVAAEEPDWRTLLTHGAALLVRSKDLRVATVLVRALVRTEGFAGLLPGLRLVHEFIHRYWDCLYPPLDADDDNDPTMRLNALAPLVHPLELVRDVRDAPLVRSRQHGQLLVRDIEVAVGKLPARPGSTPLSPLQIDAVLSAVAVEDAAAIACAAETMVAAKQLASLLDDKVGPQRAPDFRPLLATLHAVAQACGRFQAPTVAGLSADLPTDGAPPSTEPAPMPAPGPAAIQGEIRSRQDALSMIDKVVQYLERTEPTNPAPLLLKRGKRFMTMSFVDIVREIAPDSSALIDAIAGPEQKGP